MKEIIIYSQKYGNKVALVDDEDYPLLIKYRWNLRVCPTVQYAWTSRVNKKEKYRFEMHRLIMGNPVGKEVDHRDHNGLNNQKQNLRVCDKANNARNAVKPKNNTSGYKGVHFRIGLSKPWRVKIEVNKKQIYGGYHRSSLEAAKKYNELAIKHHGEFAFLNKVA